jgi:hypothetical protein
MTIAWCPLNSSRSPGTYQVDDFLKRFTRAPPPSSSARKRERAALNLFRWDVNRVARIAYVRAQRELEVEPTRREAWDLLEGLAIARPVLERLELIGDPADFAARLGGVCRPKPGEDPADDLGVTLVQILENGITALQWIRELDRYDVVPKKGPNIVPLPRWLTAGAVALYRHRHSGDLPPASRGHWLAEFLFAAWQDFEFPASLLNTDDPIGYFGTKVVEQVRETRKGRTASSV